MRPEGVELDGTAALKLEGYGGGNITCPPSFLIETALWLQSGGIWAWATLPGDGDLGAAYYEKGIGKNKPNTINAFIACAKRLTGKQPAPDGEPQQQYTSPGRLVIQGESNGGLLVLASMIKNPIRKPEDRLFGAVIARGAVADIESLYSEGDRILTQTEYGSLDKPEEREAIMSYSPVQNIEVRGADDEGTLYSSVLLQVGKNDPRVWTSQSATFAAKLQKEAHPNTGCFMSADDGGHYASTRKQDSERMALAHAFAQRVIGPINQTKYKATLIKGDMPTRGSLSKHALLPHAPAARLQCG